ncbi:hypothetical protein Desaci_0232 [Desulfosporosinus acidiphilus SJ4]|uniref:Uncharacterized protein n=1 Tax=Desulfosporosinus acidiphilus (strain DSM 22704 / JCM 16185 / SJ4) TaxID=646529 RepID=I4D0I2_DESAJ|nr:hypothetical protein [Desulfosporosinus acidiphilus]AFM39306.1 hypothetical protein Desaci_0232 [Desulfosporosinus acidiphilus SJ4]
MRQKKWEISLGIGLCALSFILYFIKDLYFNDARAIFGEILSQIAFLPLYILLSTIIMDSLLSQREKVQRLKKLNMVIGAFFSETGVELLQRLSGFDQTWEETAALILHQDWSQKVKAMERWLGTGGILVNSHAGDLEEVSTFLLRKREFLLRMLENPNLLEHESFTELLWAVFHLSEELSSRHNLSQLSEADFHHFSGDIKRAYCLLISEWLNYMIHLKEDYPFLFSFYARTNPFDPTAQAAIPS